MDFEYLKSDTKRIEKKLEELNKKYDDIERQKELDKLEERCREINSSSSDDDLKSKIWGEIYRDVFEIEKKTKPENESKKKKKSDEL